MWVPSGGGSSGLLTLNRGVGVRTPGDACARPAAEQPAEGGAHVRRIDTHKDTLAVAVIDGAGRAVHQAQYPNRDDGYRRLLAALGRFGAVRVGIEGSGNYGWPAAIYLLERGQAVVEVPPLLTSRERLARPCQGKTDPVDAVAIVRITAREPFLPPVRPMVGDTADLRVLTEYRDQLVTERTPLANRVHIDLVWLRPGAGVSATGCSTVWRS